MGGSPLTKREREDVVSDKVGTLKDLLELFYEPSEITEFLFTAHAVYEGMRPADLIALGKIDTVIDRLQAIEDGVYL